jgi:hypothetical protein
MLQLDIASRKRNCMTKAIPRVPQDRGAVLGKRIEEAPRFFPFESISGFFQKAPDGTLQQSSLRRPVVKPYGCWQMGILQELTPIEL